MTGRRVRMVVGVVIVYLAGIPAARETAWATDPSTGIAVIEGTAEFPRVPCPPPPPFGSGPCEGTFVGSWNGQIAGVAGTSRFEATWVAPTGSISAGFHYSELQCLALEGTVGIAKGTGAASAGPGQVDGQWQVTGELFARDVTGVTTTFDFEWSRVGTGVVLVLTSFALTLDVAGLPPQQVAASRQHGAAALAVAEPVPSRAPTCDDPLRDVKANLVATIAVAPNGA